MSNWQKCDFTEPHVVHNWWDGTPFEYGTPNYICTGTGDGYVERRERTAFWEGFVLAALIAFGIFLLIYIAGLMS